MSNGGSVTLWLSELREGENDAAQKLWERYCRRLITFARGRIAPGVRQVTDEEDAVICAFESFCRRVQEKRFPDICDRDGLWKILLRITACKVIDQVQSERRQKRGGGNVVGESVFLNASQSVGPWGINEVTSDEPTPDFLVMVAEEYERRLAQLQDATMRIIAQMKLEGYRNDEIAEHVGCGLRTVERKLWVIRRKWSDD